MCVASELPSARSELNSFPALARRAVTIKHVPINAPAWPLKASMLSLTAAAASVSRVAWNLGDDPWWTLGGGTDAFGVGVGVSLESGDELGHLLVALDAAE